MTSSNCTAWGASLRLHPRPLFIQNRSRSIFSASVSLWIQVIFKTYPRGSKIRHPVSLTSGIYPLVSMAGQTARLTFHLGSLARGLLGILVPFPKCCVLKHGFCLIAETCRGRRVHRFADLVWEGPDQSQFSTVNSSYILILQLGIFAFKTASL